MRKSNYIKETNKMLSPHNTYDKHEIGESLKIPINNIRISLN